MQEISSTQNSLVKKIVQLQDKSRIRKKEGLFVVEGQREINLALQSNFVIDTILFDNSLISEETINNLTNKQATLIRVSKEVYQKIAYRSSTEGVIALVKTKNSSLDQLRFATNSPLILVAEAPEKPGNIGALLRTADAANADAFLIANPKTDLYNPNIIRSSVGCVFTNQVAVGSTKDIISFLQQYNINIYAATLQNSNHYHLEDYTDATAIVVGTEATGLSEEWRNAAKQNIIIPMQGAIDSMNVSVAAGILIFEAKRQRNFK
ncbi:TrmH family RNA methyltransferase [Pseudofulvibacter geojedonensis]|uniref:TrmH family RNA methyltransferase n=1 Tax=Pseudofulvibacter geojedonensis TaxID=1123758 RepID=A0ABW3I273_9FLAO